MIKLYCFIKICIYNQNSGKIGSLMTLKKEWVEIRIKFSVTSHVDTPSVWKRKFTNNDDDDECTTAPPKKGDSW